MTLTDLIKKHGLEKVNTMTKYPSILTYHQLGEKGGLRNELIEDGFPTGTKLEITEKIDGTNARCIYLNGDFVIGAREMFVYANGDRIINSELVSPVKKGLKGYFSNNKDRDLFSVIFGEVYGYRVQEGTKIYCVDGNTETKFRIFDIWQMSIDEVDKFLSSHSLNEIVNWRNNNEQPWMATRELAEFSRIYDIDRTPIRNTIDSKAIPVDAIRTKEWLNTYKDSRAILGKGEGKNQKFGLAEGVVIRTFDRKVIRKLRFEDYRRGEMKGWK